MNKLSLLDQVFYKLEAGGMSPLLMAGTMIVDPRSSPYPLNGKKLADHLAARMEKIPLMRQKLVQDSLKIGDMRLVDDPEFDVKNHITLTKLKAPGNYGQLMDCLGAFSAQRLDLTRPLWHYEIIEGLEGGRIAVATHLHHCILDGIGARQALGSMWDEKPVPAEKPSQREWEVEETPSAFSLLWDALKENAERLYVKAPTFIYHNRSPLTQALLKSLSASIRVKGETERKAGPIIPKVHKTSLNVSHVSAARVISYVEFPFAEVKALARHYDCSINDLALLFNSFALQHYFNGIGEKIDFDLVAGMPISTRTSSDGPGGNAVSVARLSLHNRIKGVEHRLRAIMRDTALIKKPLRPAADGNKPARLDSKALMGLVSPIVLDTLIYGAVKCKLAEKATLVNIAITNVPGSQRPVYIAGARQVSMIPMGPVIDTVGMIITISSSDQHLSMGYHGCGEAITDKELFVAGARKCFEALKKAAKLKFDSDAKPAPKQRAAKRPSVKTIAKKSAVAKKSVARTTAKKIAQKKNKSFDDFVARVTSSPTITRMAKNRIAKASR